MNNDGSVEGELAVTASALPEVVNIVSAYVSNNSLRAGDLAALIESVHTAIRQLGASQAPVPEVPAVPVKKSLTKDYIVCLEDGKKFKSLRRHLSSSYNMTPEEYREKWGLPSDYPMVAPSYSATRSQLAKNSGLGQLAKGAAHRADTSDVAMSPGESESMSESESMTVIKGDDQPAADPVKAETSRKPRGRPRKAA